MRVTCSCRRLGVSKQFANDGQSETGAGAEAGVSMPQVMKTDPSKSSAFGDSPPGAIKVSPWGFVVRSGGLPRHDIGAKPGQVDQYLHGRGVEHDRLLAGLAVGEEQEPSVRDQPTPISAPESRAGGRQ